MTTTYWLRQAANASLCPCPRKLYDLWTENTVALGGGKPASQFSHWERGKSKHKFFCRNILWKMVKHLEDLGITSDMAIDQIYSVYCAQTSVTKIIYAIIDDKKRGRLNPNLVM